MTDPRHHLDGTRAAIASLEPQVDRLEAWGEQIAARLRHGGRLLAAGNGGSAAQAQHLTAELVGRYEHERPPLSAIALHADSSTFTAIANDYGHDASFARQVEAHGRPGDILVLLSTSGRSPNVVAAAHAGRAGELITFALTGRGPNELASACDDAVCIDAAATAHIQEGHLVAIHIVCAVVDRIVTGTGA